MPALARSGRHGLFGVRRLQGDVLGAAARSPLASAEARPRSDGASAGRKNREVRTGWTPATRALLHSEFELLLNLKRAVSEPYPSRKRALSEPEASQIPESEGVGRRAAAIGSNCTRALSIRMSHGHQGSGLVLGQARRTYGSQASGSFVAGAAPAKWGANCTARQVVRDRLPGLSRLATVCYRSCRNAIRRSSRRVPSPLIRALSARRTQPPCSRRVRPSPGPGFVSTPDG